MNKAYRKYNINIPDRQLACAPVDTPEAEDYFQAMAAAANYAWANRQMIVHWVRESFEQVFGEEAEDLGMKILYDVAHNIAKREVHKVNGKTLKYMFIEKVQHVHLVLEEKKYQKNIET